MNNEPLLTPLSILKDKRLSSNDKIIYSTISGGDCSTRTNKHISDLSGISVRTVITSLSKLNKIGLIELCYNKDGNERLIVINPKYFGRLTVEQFQYQEDFL